MASSVADQDLFHRLVQVEFGDQETSDDVMKYYADRAAEYDKAFAGYHNYRGPELTVEYFKKHAQKIKLDKNCRILDVAAGTGLVGQILHREGYTNIDAVDGSQSMLEEARNKVAYRNYFHCQIGPGYTVPVQDDPYDYIPHNMGLDTYDVALISGGVGPAHIQPEDLLDVIRIIKPDGLLINVMRETFMDRQQFLNFHVRASFGKWERDGIWRLREWAIPSSYKFVDEIDAIAHVYEIK